MNLGIADAADLAARIVSGETSGYSDARHAAGADVIADSERVRDFMTTKNWSKRFAVRTILSVAGYAPPFQRMLVNNFLGD